MKRKTTFLLTLFTVLIYSFVQAQSTIWENDIAGFVDASADPYTSGQVVDPDVTAAGIGRSSGLSGANANGHFNSTAFSSSSSLDPSDYLSFKLQPNANKYIDFSRFSFNYAASEQAPQLFELRYTTDNGSTFTSISSGTFLRGVTNQFVSIDLSALPVIFEPIEFRLYAWKGSAIGRLGIENFRFEGDASGLVLLPITLLSFNATIVNNGVLLTWQTANETGNDYFIVERSGNGNDFTALGKQKGAGTTQIQQDYSFIDYDTDKGTKWFYRLVQVDVDGTKNYSEIRTASIPVQNGFQFKVYPSPVSRGVELTIENAAIQPGSRFKVINSNGNLIYAGMATGKGKIKMNTQNLTGGVYFIQLPNQKLVKKFIVQ